MKPSLAYLLLSADSIQDAFSGKWTHVNIFNLFVIPKDLEFMIQNFRVAGQLNNMPAGALTAEIRIEDSKGEALASSILSGTLEKGDVQFSAIFNLVKLEKADRYFMHVYLGGKKLPDGNKYYFDVRKENAR